MLRVMLALWLLTGEEKMATLFLRRRGMCEGESLRALLSELITEQTTVFLRTASLDSGLRLIELGDE